MKELEDALDETAQASARRAESRLVAVAAVRAIERRIRDALGGLKLRGLPDLLPDAHREEFRAVRVRGHRHDDVLPIDGRAVLVLCDDGVLRMAMRIEDGSLRPRVSATAWPATDADLLAEDMEPLARRAAEVLAAHVAAWSRGAERFAGLERLAGRLRAALAA